MEAMGMTDTQFKSFLRLIIKEITSIKEQLPINEKPAKDTQELLETLQKMLED